MWTESGEHKKGEAPPVLRTGLTTGACATACSVAAAICYFEKTSPPVVSITLPKSRSSQGKTVELAITAYTQQESSIRTATVKDAGDDPDVTHGATVFVELQLCEQKGITFLAGEGVGTVTRDGLLLDKGEPAINPVPRKMITEHLDELAHKYQYSGGFIVTVGVENGQSIAQKTMNPRLGIVGGLSILGTTGIVRPFSCAAWIASIYQGIDVAAANGLVHIAASTGNRSEEVIRQQYQLDDMALIEMGDFAGAVLKHLRKLSKQTQSQNTSGQLSIHKLSICGGFGKISKLAQGHMDLNSRASSIDFDFLVEVAKEQGADDKLCQQIVQSNTSIEALQHCQHHNIALASALCTRALAVAQNIVPEQIEVEVIAIDRQGNIVATSNGDKK